MTAQILLPNLRRLFVPDPGYLIVDADLAGADAQVVAAEAGDSELLSQFADPEFNVHANNAKLIDFPYKMAKRFIHGTNYGGSARTMGASCGISTADATKAQRAWFAAHPKIKDWHARTEQQLHDTHEVRNRFGYRRFYFDRTDGLLPEALAWIPQSTVAIVTNHALVKLDADPDCVPIFQVHDSVVFQIPKPRAFRLPAVLKHLETPIPYEPPLTIPFGMKVSGKSWGDCEEAQ